MTTKRDAQAEITEAAINYIAKRRKRINLRARRNELECEEYENSDCWGPEDINKADWCRSCRNRQTIHEEYRWSATASAVALRRLERIVNRHTEVTA